MYSCPATSFIIFYFIFLSVLVRTQDYNVSGVKNIEKVKIVKIVPPSKGSKFKNRKRNNGQICQHDNDNLVPVL